MESGEGDSDGTQEGWCAGHVDVLDFMTCNLYPTAVTGNATIQVRLDFAHRDDQAPLRICDAIGIISSLLVLVYMFLY